MDPSAAIHLCKLHSDLICSGVAISGNGVDWIRGSDRITGDKGEGAASDVGMIIEPNKDWWTFDTCHLQVSDVQVGVLGLGCAGGGCTDVQVGDAWKYSLGCARGPYGNTLSDVPVHENGGGDDEAVVLYPRLQVVHHCSTPPAPFRLRIPM